MIPHCYNSPLLQLDLGGRAAQMAKKQAPQMVQCRQLSLMFVMGVTPDVPGKPSKARPGKETLSKLLLCVCVSGGCCPLVELGCSCSLSVHKCILPPLIAPRPSVLQTGKFSILETGSFSLLPTATVMTWRCKCRMTPTSSTPSSMS